MGESGGTAMMRSASFLLIAVFGLSLTTTAADGDGGYANSFQQLPLGARPTALGGAYRAVSDDGAGMLFNPAGLTSLSGPLLTSAYRVMKLDRSLGYVGAITPVKGDAILGAQWLFAGSGKVQARDSDGRSLGRDLYLNTNVFSVVFAKRFEEQFSLGVNLSYADARMPEISANTIGVDFGAMLHVDYLFDREQRLTMPVQAIQVGLAVRNLQKLYKWNSEKYNLRFTTDGVGIVQEDRVPVEIGLGASARFFKRNLLVAADFAKNAEQAASAAIGAEYQLIPDLMLRGGYGQSRLSAGAGFLFRLGKQTLAVDYAFSTDRADEGSEHLFSFDLLF